MLCDSQIFSGSVYHLSQPHHAKSFFFYFQFQRSDGDVTAVFPSLALIERTSRTIYRALSSNKKRSHCSFSRASRCTRSQKQLLQQIFIENGLEQKKLWINTSTGLFISHFRQKNACTCTSFRFTCTFFWHMHTYTIARKRTSTSAPYPHARTHDPGRLSLQFFLFFLGPRSFPWLSLVMLLDLRFPTDSFFFIALALFLNT